ncbi:MAG: DUF502 domain-containing protein [Nitrospirales bacterium]|nr:DUF502 domain-containing protein [Nitrospirales bacterium]
MIPVSRTTMKSHQPLIPRAFKRYFVTGILVLVPAWGTFLILETLFTTLDHLWIDLLGNRFQLEIPGVGIASLFFLIIVTGMLTTHFLGQRLLLQAEESLGCIPIVRSIYHTFKGMTDVFNFRNRVGHSTVVVFPFPKEGTWALGFMMGKAPYPLQISENDSLAMVFVPTAIHPFTGYLAFIPEKKARRVQLRPQEAMKMEFSAGFYHPPAGWLMPWSTTTSPKQETDSNP